MSAALGPNADMSLILAAIPVLLLGAGLCASMRSNRAGGLTAILTQALACALVLLGSYRTLLGAPSIEQTWAWVPPIEQIAFRVDALSAFFLAWSLPMTVGATVYALGYLQPYFAQGRHGGPHYALLNLVSLSFILIYTTQNALVFLLGWEVAAVVAWLLVIWDYRDQRVRFAGFNYLVSTHVGLFVLVAAFMLLHSKTGSMDLQDFGRYLSSRPPARSAVFVLLGVAFALKSAFFPFHTWLPRAHAAAPAHVSALMSGVIHKAGLFAFLRFSLLMGRPDEWMGWSVLAFGAASALLGVLFTSTQRNLKRLLGYSSTENVGIAAIGFGVGYLGWSWNEPVLAACGFAGGLLHVFNHALFKCLLFYAAGAVYRTTHTVDIERLGGLAKRMPKTAALFLLGAIAISALPPLNGFVSEYIIYSGLLSGSAPSSSSDVALVGVAAILAFVGAVSALSMTRAFGVAFLGNPRDASVQTPCEAPRTMLWPMALHALGALAIGLLPELGVMLVRSSSALFPVGGALGVALPPFSSVAWVCRSLALALLGAGVFGWLRGRGARRSDTWGCGYAAVNPRMQYGGSSFSEHFARIFASVMPAVHKERLPSEFFPQESGHLRTHHPDPVEHRMFEVLFEAQDFIAQLARRVPEQPRFAFAAGLFTLLLIGAWLLQAGPP